MDDSIWTRRANCGAQGFDRKQMKHMKHDSVRDIRDAPKDVKETSRYTKFDAKIERPGVCSPGVVHQFLDL